jgi:hypothetical protein
MFSIIKLLLVRRDNYIPVRPERLHKMQILPLAGGPRYCLAAAFHPLKKYAAHFFNPAFGDTG